MYEQSILERKLEKLLVSLYVRLYESFPDDWRVAELILWSKFKSEGKVEQEQQQDKIRGVLVVFLVGI